MTKATVQALTPSYESGPFKIYLHRCLGRSPKSGSEEIVPRNEIAFPLSGAYVRRCGQSTDVADPMTALFFQRDIPYEIDHPICGGDATLVVQSRTSDFLSGNDPFHSTGNFVGSRRLRVEDWRSVIALYEGVSRKDRTDCLSIDETVTVLANRLANPTQVQSDDRPLSDRQRIQEDVVRKALIYINRHFREQISLTEISGTIGSSPYNLCRLFKGRVGETLHAYQIRRRVRESMSLLRYTGMPLSEIAFDLGFSSHSHFGATFVRLIGDTPSEFREQYRSVIT